MKESRIVLRHDRGMIYDIVSSVNLIYEIGDKISLKNGASIREWFAAYEEENWDVSDADVERLVYIMEKA